MHRYLARRLGALLVTVVAAVAIGHVFLATTVESESLPAAVGGIPAYLHGDFGRTFGNGCEFPHEHIKLCARYGESTVAAMLRQRVPVDIALLLGSLLLGTLAGIAGGRRCALRPGSLSARVLHVLTAFLLACPPYFLAFMVLSWFSWKSGTIFQIPIVSGQGDYGPFGESPLRWLRAMWVPWLLCALPLAAYVLRLTETTLRDVLQEDYVRTARAKGLPEAHVTDRHALPIVGPSIAAMTGVNVSTLLIHVAVIEYGFAIPGMFRVIYSAALRADVPVMMGLVIEGVFLITLANFLADAFQQLLDPRVRMQA